MSREYKIEMFGYHAEEDMNALSFPQIVPVYNEPGLSWRDAKKSLRQWYLDQARAVRALREKDIHVS